MNEKQHAGILTAYLHRMKRSDIDALIQKLDANIHACRQLGIGSQCATWSEMDRFAAESMRSISEYDLGNVELIIARNIKGSK